MSWESLLLVVENCELGIGVENFKLNFEGGREFGVENSFGYREFAVKSSTAVIDSGTLVRSLTINLSVLYRVCRKVEKKFCLFKDIAPLFSLQVV